MVTMPTIVAFSWQGGAEHFHESAEKLKSRCEALGLPHRVTVRADLTEHFAARPGDDWMGKRWCYRYIPTFVLAELDRGPEDVLYVHADYRIRRRPPVEAFEGLDVGLQRRWAWRPETSTLPGLAAPIFARNNPRTRRFLRAWRSVCAELDDGSSEHRHLLNMFDLFRRKDRTCRLGWFPINVASQAADADCAIVGHKRERK